MISLDLKQHILLYYRVDELSLREISRRTGTDRKTVTRLINAYELAVKENPETGIEDFLADRPKYKSRTYTPRVVLPMNICALETLFAHAIIAAAIILFQPLINLFCNLMSQFAGTVFTLLVIRPLCEELLHA